MGTKIKNYLNRKIQFVLFTLVAILAYTIYAQSFNAGWTFDDKRQLQHLSQVTDFNTAMVYLVKEKNISPTDRPVSMASFLLNINDWPNNRASFRQTNTLLHILNGLLLLVIARAIAKLIPSLRHHQNGFAISLTAIWMLHPLLASTSFHIIQRMVLLAATFSLVGVVMYLHGRNKLTQGDKDGFAWMSAGMIVSVGIGTLAKENAALTPLMLAALEFTVLNRFAPLHNRYITLWRLLFFALPAALLLAYAAYYLNSAHLHYLTRPFTLDERIFSEGIILFDYLRQLLVPDITVMGPYQDDILRIRGAELTTWIALSAWLLLLSLALVWQRRYPAFSFGVLFFLAGHLLESTIFSLELYFEHRNYLPSLGPIGALVATAWVSNKNWPKYTSFGFAALMGLLLWQTTTLWGNDKESAMAWNKKHPTSTRATQNLATYYQKLGKYDKAASTIIQGYQNNRFSGPLAVNVIISMCFDTPATQEHKSLPDQIAKDAQKLDYNNVVLTTLHNQISLFANGKCNAFNANQSIAVARGLLTNPAYQKPAVQYGLLMAIARAMETQGRKGEAIQTKIDAFRLNPAALTAQTIFFQLLEMGRKDAAVAFLNEARKLTPAFSALYDSWEQSIQEHNSTTTLQH